MEALEDFETICVDTDILIDFLQKKDPGSHAYKRWRHARRVAVTSVTAFELLFGARQSNLPLERFEEARSLVEQHHVFPFDASAANKASEIGAELGRLGKAIEIRDLFNAAICLSQNVSILTRNNDHYKRVAGLRLLDVHAHDGKETSREPSKG